VTTARTEPRPARLAPTAARRHPWVPVLSALAAAVIGGIDVADAVTPGFYDRVRWITGVVPGALSHAATAATAVVGILLLLFAHALKRRKRRAWLAVVVLLGSSVVFHVVKGLDVEEALVALLMLVVLVVYRAASSRSSVSR
jgi:lysyl-tRNA synthetase, class II